MASVANWRKTKTPGVDVAHKLRCPAESAEDSRSRYEHFWRGRRRHPATGKPNGSQPVVSDRSEVLAWLAAVEKGAAQLRQRASSGRTFESIGDEWIAGVAAGRIGRRGTRQGVHVNHGS